ncbi:MAG: hypothetical protein LBP69_10275, partial [Treponema sp.]|nr:hypothetical protein [Treponema sp.]
FEPVPLYFGKDVILKTAKSAPQTGQEPWAGQSQQAERELSAGENRPSSQDQPAGRGPSLDKHYSGYYWNGGERESGWEYAIPNFNILEGDCDLYITWRDEICTLKLYPVEMWTYLKRDYLPGRTGPPKIFLVTLAIPENAFDGLSADFGARLAQKYAKNDKKLFHYTIAASDRYIFMWETGRTESGLFLTGGTLPNQHFEFQKIWSVAKFEEIQRYYSPELAMDRRAATHEELVQKIELNKMFRDELKYQIRVLKWSRLTAFKFTAGYIPFHYLITPLRFVDVPKIRTVTSFGDKIILTNNLYVTMFSDIRIWIYEKIIELLELRLFRYNELARELAETNASSAAETSGPLRCSENIADYWDIAGLPHVISGTFFGPRPGQQTQRYAVLSFRRSGTEPELFGWCFAIGESVSAAMADDGFSLFIDPLKNPGVIHSLAAKDPKQKRVRLDCTLYSNPGTNSPVAQEIIDHILKPFIVGHDRGIKVRISFDEDRFEIRQRPAQQGNSLIFSGKAVSGHDKTTATAGDN